MSKIRVGLVGCGRIAQFHLDALKANSHYAIEAVCDVLADRATAAAVKYGARAHSSMEEMLASARLDLIVLTTPSNLHPSQAIQCADAGIACLSEKPFGVFYEEALRAVEHFEVKRVPLFVVKQNRYNPTVQKVRSWYESGILGQIYLIQANVFWQRPQSYYDAETWRGKRAQDGGAFMNQASHYVDLVQWFGGEVTSVQSELATRARKMECEDTGAALIRFKSGTIGTIAVTMLTYPENAEGSLMILAENGTIKIGGKAMNKLELVRVKGVSEVDNVSYEPSTVYGNGHTEYYRQLVEFLANPQHPGAITGREGLKSLKLLTEIYRDEDKKRGFHS